MALLAVTIVTAVSPFAASAGAMRCEAIFEEAPATIQEELTTAFFNGAQNFYEAERWGAHLRTLPDARRESYIRELAKIYRTFPKSDPRPTPRNTIGGRRLLDFMMSQSFNRAEKFKAAVDTGKNPADLYREYLEGQKDAFKINYGADEIFAIVRLMQSELKAIDMNGYPNEIFIGGSFINGKASLLNSDIDISVNNPPLLKNSADWQAKINDQLRKTRPEANLEIEGHGQPANFYGKLNPFVIAITKTGARLMIFPPGAVGMNGFALNSTTPFVFDLNL